MRTGSTTADGRNTYAYDPRGRLVQATSSLGATAYQVKRARPEGEEDQQLR